MPQDFDFGSDADFGPLINGRVRFIDQPVIDTDAPGWDQHAGNPNACPYCGYGAHPDHDGNCFTISHPGDGHSEVHRYGVCHACGGKWVENYRREVTRGIKGGKPIVTLDQFVDRLVYVSDLSEHDTGHGDDHAGVPGWIYPDTGRFIEDRPNSTHYRTGERLGRFTVCIIRTERWSDDLKEVAALLYQWCLDEDQKFVAPPDWQRVPYM